MAGGASTSTSIFAAIFLPSDIFVAVYLNYNGLAEGLIGDLSDAPALPYAHGFKSLGSSLFPIGERNES